MPTMSASSPAVCSRLSPDLATRMGGVDTHPGGLAASLKDARSASTVSRRWVSGLAGPPGLTPAPTAISTRPPEIWSAVRISRTRRSGRQSPALATSGLSRSVVVCVARAAKVAIGERAFGKRSGHGRSFRTYGDGGHQASLRLGLDYLRQLDPCARVLAEPEVPASVDEHVTAFAFSGVVNRTWLEPQVGYR